MKYVKCNKEILISDKNKEVSCVDSGDTFQVECLNAFGERFTNMLELKNILEHSNEHHHHPLTGPITVPQAEKGDILKVTIVDIKLKEMAQMLSKTAGIEPQSISDFSGRAAMICKDLGNEIEYYHSDIKLKLNPCVGIIATTPNSEEIKTGHIGRTGGNFDNPFVTIGSSIYLPVEVDGAKLYFGDIHAVQSYGELSGIALEASADITVKVEVLKAYSPFETSPIFIMGNEPLSAKRCLAIIGIGKSFKNGDEAVRDSYTQAVEVIKRIKPTLPEEIIKNMLSLIGHSMSGQAYSNTSESTNQILFTEDTLKMLNKTESPENVLQEVENILFYHKTNLRSDKILVTVGATKGRNERILHEYLMKKGIEIPKLDKRELVYDIETDSCILRVFLLKWKDITKNYDKFDLVIFGTDKWMEQSNKTFAPLEYFEQKGCRMSLLVPENYVSYSLDYFLKRKIATSYPNILREYLDVMPENIIEMEGSVEASIKLGWASAIFDVVETGDTALANGLVEYKEVLKFAAVLATPRVDKIPIYINLGLFDDSKIRNRLCIAFDGIDGSGKSTLSKSVVQNGMFYDIPVILTSPYSGRIAKMYKSLQDSKDFINYAMCIGKYHWRASNIISSVYDRSILTCMTDIIDEPEEVIDLVIKTWGKLPDVLFYCKLPAEIAYGRAQKREKKDEYDESISSLRYYEERYERVVEYLKKKDILKIVELDATKSTSENLTVIKNIIKGEF